MESLLTSPSTFLYNQINFMTSQDARKVGGPFWTRHDSPDLARNTIQIRSSVIVRNLYGIWYMVVYIKYMVMIVGIR